MNDYYALKTAGFTDVEIDADLRARAKAAGFTDQEAAADIFQQSISPDQQAYDLLNKPNPALLDYFGRSFAKAQDMPAPLPKAAPGPGGPEETALSAPVSGQYIDVTQRTEPTYGQAISTGFNQSIVGLFMAHLTGKDKAPESVMGDLGPAEFKPGLTPEQQQDLPQGKRLAMQAAGVAGDIPAMALGAIGGAELGPVGATAGSFAMPAAIRSILMAEYEKGQIQTPTDFIQRGAVAMWEASKGAAVGAVTGVAARAGGAVSPLLRVPAEVVAMTTAAAAVEGHMPAARDFVDGAILIGGMHAATAGVGKAVRGAQDLTPKLRKVYEKTGIRPEQVIEDIKGDPSIRADLMAVGGPEVPRAYESKIDLPPWEYPDFVPIEIKPTAKAPGGMRKSDLNAMFEENLRMNDAWRVKSLLLYGVDPGGYVAPATRAKGSVGPGLDINDARARFGDAALEGIQYGLVKKGGMKLDQLMQQFEIADESVILDALRFKKGEAQKRFVDSLAAMAPTQKAKFDPNRPVMPAEPVGMDGVTKISDVVKLLEEKMGTPIRTGGFRNAAQGIYKTGDKVIRTKIANNISTIAHEIGHDLQKTLFGAVTDKPLEPWRTELEAIATRPKEGGSVLGEGFAEFVARYVVNPADAKKVAPGFFESFEASMDKTAPELKAILVEAQGMVKKWQEQPAVMRILSHISIGEKEPWLLERAIDPQTWETLYTRTVDKLNPISQIVKEGLRPGEKLRADVDPYNLARRFAGTTGAATSFIESQPFRFKDKASVGKSFKSVLDGVENLDEFLAYLVSKSQIERGERGMLSPGFTEDAKAVVKELGPKYEAKAQELYDFKNAVLDYVRDSGVYSAETVEGWRKAWQSHVSFSRVMDAAEGFGGTGKSMQAAKTIKKAKGSGRDIVNPLESTLEDAYRLLNMAERNRVVESLVHFAETHDALGKWIEKVPNPQKAVKVRTDEILKAIEEYDLGASVHAAVLFENADLATTVFRPDSYLDKKTQIALYRDGARTVYQVDPELANVIHNLDAQSMNMLTRILAVPARVLRVGATSTPPFLIMNAVRDSFSTGVYSPGFIPIVDTVRGIFAMAKNDKLYRQWIEDGGEQFAMVGMDRGSLQKSLKALTETGVTDNLWNVVKHPLEMARVFGELSEGGTRVGAYMKDRRKLGDSMAARAEASLKSRDLMDFARKGGDPGVQQFSQMTAFWNARIQGIDKMIRAFKEDPQGATLRALAIYTVPSVMLAISNFVDEPREEQDRVWSKAATGQELNPIEHDLYMRMQIAELPEWRKNYFWNVRAGDFVFPIPKGYDLGVLFASVPERITNWMLGRVHKNGTGEEFKGLVGTLLGGASPLQVPTFGVVPMEMYFNQSIFFSGRPIVPAQRQDALPELQYTPNTTQTTRELSRVIGELPNMREYTFSPAKAEHLIRGWTGGLGNYALRSADWALRSAGVVPNPTRPDLKLSDVPAIQSFVIRYPSGGTESIAKFYDNYKETQKYVKSVSALQGEMRFQDAARIMGDGGINTMQGAYQAMSAMQDAIHNINDNPQMDGTKKREMIDSIYLQMNTVARHGNDTYKAVQKLMKEQREAQQ